VLLEDCGDGRPRHAVPQILQCALDARVAPARILGRHPYGQSANLCEHVGPSTPTLLAGPFRRDERPPTKNRIGRDYRRHLEQNLATEPRSEDRQPPPFVVGQPHALVVELCLQDSVLVAQVLDDLGLAALEPPDEKRDEQLQRKHASSLRQRSAEFSDTTPSTCAHIVPGLRNRRRRVPRSRRSSQEHQRQAPQSVVAVATWYTKDGTEADATLGWTSQRSRLGAPRERPHLCVSPRTFQVSGLPPRPRARRHEWASFPKAMRRVLVGCRSRRNLASRSLGFR
jgi:hypothetical protein